MLKNILTITLFLGLLAPSLSFADQAEVLSALEIKQIENDQIIPIFFFLTQEDSPSIVAVIPLTDDLVAYVISQPLLGVDYKTAEQAVKYILSLSDDQLNGTGPITDGNGGMVQLLDYHPYGTMRVDWQYGAQDEERKFAGTEYDRTSGLNYMQARYYTGTQGRFISQDPVFWEVGQTSDGKKALLDPQSQNSYSYANDNPITKSDPTGRFVDALLDFAFIANDIRDIQSARSGNQSLTMPMIGLGLDVLGAAIPGVAGLGAGAKTFEKSIANVTEKSVNKNANNAVSNFGVYEIKVDGGLYKYGKADLERTTQSSNQPTRLHQQLRTLKTNSPDSKIEGGVIQNLGNVTTQQAKQVETSFIQKFFDTFNKVPQGNIKSFKPEKK